MIHNYLFAASCGQIESNSDESEVSFSKNTLTDNNRMVIKKERQIKADTKTVWAVLTKPDEIKKWLGVETKSEWTPQSDIIFTFTWNDKDYADKGKIIRLDNEEAFSYSYWSGFSGLPDEPENYSKIEFLLEPTNHGVILKLTHSEFATETMYQHSEKNWEETLDIIRKLSEEKSPNH